MSDPTFASGLVGGFFRLIKEEGFLKGFYSGFGPILMKQVPYTMTKFAVQGSAQDTIAAAVGTPASEAKGLTKACCEFSAPSRLH